MVIAPDMPGSRHESLRVLYSTNCPPDYIPPVPFAPRMMLCGPVFENREEGGRIESIRTPKVYDIAALVRALPSEQHPDLVVVRTDSALVNLPVNLAGLRCPKILLFADTHHTRDPIRTALQYAASEPFDRTVLLYDRHHLHWFQEAGIGPVSFLPGLEVRDVPVEFTTERQRQIVFVGTLGGMHRRRTWYVEEMARRGYPLSALRAPRDDSARLSAASLITFNCSLNGDLNMRVFEALAAGGFLLTDRLAPHSGLEALFADGRDLVCYDSPGDFFAKLDHYLDRPSEVLAIARSGYERFHCAHRPAEKIAALLDAVIGGVALPDYGIAEDPRGRRPAAVSGPVAMRLPVYEFLQELQRRQEVVEVLCVGLSGLAEDLQDLPRVRCVDLSAEPAVPDAAAPGDGRPAAISAAEAGRRTWHALAAQRRPPEALAALARAYRCDYLAVADLPHDGYPDIVAPLAAAGLRLLRIGTPVFVRADAPAAPEDRELFEPSRVTLFERASEIAHASRHIQGWTNSQTGQTLYQLARLHCPVPTIVELGAWKGASTAWLAGGLRERGAGRIYAVDTWAGSAGEPEHRELLRDYGPDQLFEEFRSNIARLGLGEFVEPVRGDTLAAARAWPAERPIGLLFIDADHRYEAVKADFEAWSPHLVEGGFIVFDDVPSWEGPTRLVAELPPEYQLVYAGYNAWIGQKVSRVAGTG